MKVSYNWLKDYVDIDLPAERVAEILTDTGLEVEDCTLFEPIPGSLKGVVVGEVLECAKHPNADTLKLCIVNVGEDEALKIVCGAPNVAMGQKVAVALVGTTLYTNAGESFKIKKSKIRGEASFGMICAEDELGLGADHDGIIVLDSSTIVGTPLADLYDIEPDYVFEIGLTPNRSDAMSHIGVARDLVAALNVHDKLDLKLNFPDTDNFSVDENRGQTTVSIDDAKSCPRYSGLCLTNIKTGDSPDWIKRRLSAVGVRPINNVVDITNYVLHEFGQPLHAFDSDCIAGDQVIVRNAREGEEFVTLDGVKRSLHEEDLMICDAEKPMCIAGVFGGEQSGVTDGTEKVFLESAHFHPIQLRKTSNRHNLRTDAVMKFEKGTDPESTIPALKRAALLLKEYAGAVISSEIIDDYPQPIEKPQIQMRFSQLNRLAGAEIPRDQVENILQCLDIEIVQTSDESLTLDIPLYRNDVLREVDVIEEVMRIYGFNSIPVSGRVTNIVEAREGVDKLKLIDKVSAFLAARGFAEIMTNSIANSAWNDLQIELENQVILSNSLTEELDSLRVSMLPGFLDSIAHNINRRTNNLRFFEFGKVYERNEDAFEQFERLFLASAGNWTEGNWLVQPAPVSYYHLKTEVESLLELLNLNVKYQELESSRFAYGMEGLSGDLSIVKIGSVKPEWLQKKDIQQEIFAAEFNWDGIMKRLKKSKVSYTPISKFPSSRRDLAMVIEETVPFATLNAIARKNGGPLLRETGLFDVYRGKNIKEGKKSCAMSFIFLNEKKTITDKEIDKSMSRMIKAFESEVSAEIRK